MMGTIKLEVNDESSPSIPIPNKYKTKEKSSPDKDSGQSPNLPYSHSPESPPFKLLSPPSPVLLSSPSLLLSSPLPDLTPISPSLLTPPQNDLTPPVSSSLSPPLSPLLSPPPPQLSLLPPSPSPPPLSLLPPSPPPLSLPLPSLPPPPPLSLQLLSPPPPSETLSGSNDTSFFPHYSHKQSSPPPSLSPPPFNAPHPPDRPSLPPIHNSTSNDSSPGTSDKTGSGSGSSHQTNASIANSTNSSPVMTSSSGDGSGKHVGYTLAGIFAVALVAVAVALVFAFKRKKSRADTYSAVYMAPLNVHVKPGSDGHYYVQQPSHANNYGYGNVSMKNLDSPQPRSTQICFTYEMIMEITNSFSTQNVIGEGGFGCVYKGCLADGRAVAVKRLKAASGEGERAFKAEVEIISRVHHRHLVSLVGYCIFEQQRILIYKYVPNGTLYHHLHGSGVPVLNWAKRLKIAIGAAKGLAYLHDDCSQKIIHRDIKSGNILLDNAYEAQVADFGLARLADAANTHVSTRVIGTFGYMAPEYATSGKLTDRSDVYSFGVVLLELVTGRKPVDQTQLGDQSLVKWARPFLHRAIETRDFSEVVDPRLEKQFVESEMFRMIEAASACVRHSALQRPRMLQVVRALDCGDEGSDLSNGVKYGHSMVFDSAQYDKEINIFRRMANGTFVDSDFDMLSTEYSLSRYTSRESQLITDSCSFESESRAINTQKSSSTE